jgi:hypothetical protein
MSSKSLSNSSRITEYILCFTDIIIWSIADVLLSGQDKEYSDNLKIYVKIVKIF